MSTPPTDAYLMLIGAMKAGTSTLYEHLIEHPAICPCATKEPGWFTPRFRGPADAERYEDLWNFDPSVHRYALDGSTSYTKYPSQQGTPEAVADYGIEPRLLYIVRDPIERIVSHVNFMADKGASVTRFDADHMVNTSRYHQQLERWLAVFPRERLLLLDFDDLKRDPAAMLARIYGWLELDPVMPASFETRNKTRVRSPLERKLQGSRLKRFVPAGARQRARKVVQRLAPSRDKRRPTDAELAKLRGLLRDDMLRLQSDFGVDVSRWGF